jgi:hypothetical protein
MHVLLLLHYTQDTVGALERTTDRSPELISELNMPLIDSAGTTLQELVTHAKEQSASNMLIQCAASRRVQLLADSASKVQTHVQVIDAVQIALSLSHKYCHKSVIVSTVRCCCSCRVHK